ncbi:sn-glycerol-1-phosphate dehydrogenase [Paenibacillus sp. DXFW5]|uniref:Sn-glycerol-1-phosphate dehydrogenase n=1 Tax=Paenibacillus rhizolycopersici TaxID=2780073 RepID=A0ABS2H9M8_9BACL|nr:sn-glycerol-1-phosphate dehydrogenase [Paenibacillus rhizolycopersici]MBM6996203.1 sn-glycerol-1-phosphate dehydrogenase [Paenibacillus rhizolycopersici]
MTDILNRIRELAAGLGEPYRQAIDLDEIRVETGALQLAAHYVTKKNYRNVIVAVDQNTYEAVGKQLVMLLETEKERGSGEVDVYTTMIQPDAEGDVIADEASLIELILDVQRWEANVIVACGGGTLHDICRYAAYTTGIPFVSVPTAPSVDGFNSKGAPILLRGEKKTIPAIGPKAIFADLDVLVQAPPELVAAGFGDMLGKYTSLFDWRFGSWTADEPYLELAAEITRKALDKCVASVDAIAARSEEGICLLMSSLIESGLAMLLFGQSHPASGAEHHLSHYWEMEYLRLGRRQLLHGAKVGVASMEIAGLYHRLVNEGFGAQGIHPAAAVPPQVTACWEQICQEIQLIPDPHQLGELLAAVGGPNTMEQLGVEPGLLERSLREAHRVRPGRHTLLRAYNEINETFAEESPGSE